MAAIDLNFENPDTATILHGIAEGKNEADAPIINEGTPLAYRMERINDRLVSIRPHPLYHKNYDVLTFLDAFLAANKDKYTCIIVDTGLNLPNLMSRELKNEKWPKNRPVPTIYQLYSFSSGLRPWEVTAFDETIATFKFFFGERFDETNLVHVFNPQAFIPNSLSANLQYAYRAQYKFEGADQMVKKLKKLEKQGKRDVAGAGSMFRPVPWEEFKKDILLGIRNEFWKRPLGEFWKDEIPAIVLEVVNAFLKERQVIPTNIFFHPYVYHRVQMIVDDLIIRRGKNLDSIKDLVSEVYKNYEDFLEIRSRARVP